MLSTAHELGVQYNTCYLTSFALYGTWYCEFSGFQILRDQKLHMHIHFINNFISFYFSTKTCFAVVPFCLRVRKVTSAALHSTLYKVPFCCDELILASFIIVTFPLPIADVACPPICIVDTNDSTNKYCQLLIFLISSPGRTPGRFILLFHLAIDEI